MQYPGPIYCQFDEDVTTFFIPGPGLDPIGGKIPPLNNLVVAFLPTTTGTNPGQTPPSNSAPTITGSCVNGCVPIGSVPNGSTITFTEGAGGTFEVSITAGYPAPSLSESGTLPTGLTFNNTSGTISGTPADGTAGSYSITFTAANGVGSDTLSYVLMVGPAGALTITASSPSMTYGGTVPAITASYSGFVNEDSSASLTALPTCTTTATSSSPVGSYPTTCSGAADANYSTINYVSGTVTVNPALVTVTASSPSMTYGGTVPTITPGYSYPAGAVNDHTPATPPICSTTATSTSVPGSYPSTCTGAADPDYTFSYVAGTVTVSKALVTVTASSGTMTQGGTPLTITPGYSYPAGAANDHTPATPPICSTTATSTSAPGSYPSTCTGAADPDYTFNYVNGTVTVVGLEIPLTVNFGQLYLGQLGIQFVNLKNNGTAPITISSVKLGGGTAPSDFGDVAFCPPMILRLPATLPAGKSCAIGVAILATAKVFSPTASTTTMTITDSAASQTVLLTAQVIDPLVSLSSTSLSFGSQKTGMTSAAKEVTLTNAGATSLQITGLTASANFALTSGAGTNCTTFPTLSPGGTCAIYVTFTPTKMGAKYSGSVTITDNAWSGRQTISLSGTGD
jgi:hypothetical protein